MRTHPTLLALVAALALSGCGGDDAAETPVSDRTTQPEATSTPAQTATPATTPTPTATPGEATPTPAPEQGEGGAGDEEGIEQPARFTHERGGRLAPRRVEVAAFLPVRLTVFNDATSEVRIEMPSLGVEPAVLGPGESRDVTLSGPPTGRHEIRAGDAVAILEATPGGPG